MVRVQLSSNATSGDAGIPETSWTCNVEGLNLSVSLAWIAFSPSSNSAALVEYLLVVESRARVARKENIRGTVGRQLEGEASSEFTKTESDRRGRFG